MKTQEILDRLCQDGEGSPFPIEALFTLEGLQYIELIGLLKAHEKGEEMPPWQELAGATRRRMAKALGADTPEKEVEVAKAAGPALDAVAKQARKARVELPLVARDELLRVATAIFAGRVDAEGCGTSFEFAVRSAEALIRQVDYRMADSSEREAREKRRAEAQAIRVSPRPASAEELAHFRQETLTPSLSRTAKLEQLTKNEDGKGDW